MKSNVTVEQWEAKGQELFGEDQRNWRFRCPACGNELSIKDAEQRHPDVAGKGWRPESECIGRYTRSVECDWAAYGLFRGPLSVRVGDEREIAAFDFAGQPFTGKGDAT